MDRVDRVDPAGRFVAPAVSRDLPELVQPLDRDRAGTLLLAALGMGVLGNILIFPDLLGAGATLWAVALLAGLAWSIRRRRPDGGAGANVGLIGGGKFAVRGLDGLFLLALAAALCASWRDAPFLRVCSVLLFFLTVIWIQLLVNGIRLFPAPTVAARTRSRRYAWLIRPCFDATGARPPSGARLVDGCQGRDHRRAGGVLLGVVGRADARFSAPVVNYGYELATGFARVRPRVFRAGAGGGPTTRRIRHSGMGSRRNSG